MGTNDQTESRLKTIYNFDNTKTAIKNFLQLSGGDLKNVDTILMLAFDEIKGKSNLASNLKLICNNDVIFSPPFYSEQVIANSLVTYLLHDLGANESITLEQVENSGVLEKLSENTYVLSVRRLPQ